MQPVTRAEMQWRRAKRAAEAREFLDSLAEDMGRCPECKAQPGTHASHCTGPRWHHSDTLGPVTVPEN